MENKASETTNVKVETNNKTGAVAIPKIENISSTPNVENSSAAKKENNVTSIPKIESMPSTPNVENSSAAQKENNVTSIPKIESMPSTPKEEKAVADKKEEKPNDSDNKSNNKNDYDVPQITSIEEEKPNDSDNKSNNNNDYDVPQITSIEEEKPNDSDKKSNNNNDYDVTQITSVEEEKPNDSDQKSNNNNDYDVPQITNVEEEEIDLSEDEEYVKKLVDNKLNSISNRRNVYGVGKVVSIKDFIIEVVGLEAVSFNEKVKIGEKAIGYVIQMKPNKVEIALLSQTKKINIGDSVYQTNELLTGEFSYESFGRVIDLFGYDKLTNKKFSNTVQLPIEYENVPIMDRISVSRPLETGISGIDLIYPIGKGQRQLIIGDKKTGKTQIALDTIVNQANKNMICIYVAIGKTKKEIKEIYYELVKRKAHTYTIIVTAFYDDLPSILTLTPYFALSIANYYMNNKYDVLVVLDDLKKHADAYRQISLISGKSPGRDAYPADIFYFHSRLLEKGCQHKNGGSITILPIMETRGGDITDYISTNIISITDGQIVLSRDSFVKGEKPAINYGLSVSRLGGSVQDADMKALGANIRQTLLSYLETRSVYELANVDEMSKDLQDKLFRGKNILNALSQYKFSPLNKSQIIEKFKALDSSVQAQQVQVTQVQNISQGQAPQTTQQVTNNG